MKLSARIDGQAAAPQSRLLGDAVTRAVAHLIDVETAARIAMAPDPASPPTPLVAVVRTGN